MLHIANKQHMFLSRGVPIAYSLPTWLIMEAFINLAYINLACINLAHKFKNHGLPNMFSVQGNCQFLQASAFRVASRNLSMFWECSESF